MLAQFSVSGGEALLADPEVNVIELASTAHRQIHMRTSKGPFADKRVRQALAMAMNRPEIIAGLFEGKAEQGNDSPFFCIFPSTGTPKERTFALDEAKALMAEAAPDGLDVTLHSWETQEIPDLAVLVQNAAKEIGINVTIALSDDYYDNFWVAFDPSIEGSDLGITDYGHRGVPDVFLVAPLKYRRLLERRRVLQPRVRRPRRRPTSRRWICRPSRLRRADPGPVAGRGADHLPVQLQLPVSHAEERHRRCDVGHGSRLHRQGQQELRPHRCPATFSGGSD